MQQAILALLLILPSVAFSKKQDRYVSFSLNIPALDLELTNEGTEQKSGKSEKPERPQSLLYLPKPPVIVGAGVSMWGLSLGISTDLGSGPDEEQLDYEDYSLDYAIGSLMTEMSYTQFVGFTLADINGEELGEDRREERFREDFAVRATNIDITYLFLNFGLEASRDFDISRSDRRSGVGIGLNLTYDRTELAADEGLIPEQNRSGFGVDAGIISGTFEAQSMALAIAGSLSLGPLFTSLLFRIGRGNQRFNYDNSESTIEAEGPFDRTAIFWQGGFTAGSLFFAVLYKDQSPSYVLKHLTITSTRNELAFVTGFRF